MKQKERGRPMSSRNVRITPELRDSPDIEKLARALLAVASHIVSEKRSNAAETLAASGKGDDMT